ncbi:MAG: glycosyltransferase family 4 protein [Candidatus Neomarinimicrobiota bacterium]
MEKTDLGQRPLRILVFIIQFPPDVNSTGILMDQICEGLLEYGHRITVITTFPHYEEFRIHEEFRGRLIERGQYHGLDVIRLCVYANGEKYRMTSRLLNYLSFNFLATAVNLVSRQTYDVIFCTNGSFFTGISSYVSGKFGRIPFIYNVQDLYPDVPIRAGQLHNKNAITVLRKMERFMYEKAAHIAVIAPSFRKNLLEKGVSREKVSVIPNFVDTAFVRPMKKKNEFSIRHDLTDKFVVTHAGNLGYAYDLETMLEAALLLAPHENIVFLIIGDGVAKAHLQEKAQTLRLSNVRFLPFQPREYLPLIRACSDVETSLYKPGASSDSMPSKVYEIMASGRPLLMSADEGSDVWNLVTETKSGICIGPGNASELADGVLSLYNNPSMGQKMGQRGRYQAEKNYSRDVVVRRYNGLLQQVARYHERTHS